MHELVFGSDAASARSTHSAAFLWQYSAVIISATPRSTLLLYFHKRSANKNPLKTSSNSPSFVSDALPIADAIN